jgi:hypothetical protein
LFDKAAQLWTRLEEDPQVQRWDKEEERINVAIQELKQKKNTIPIPECVKGTQEIKKLQAELISAQTQKQERQAQMEPLQEQVAEVLAQAEEAKTQIAQTQAECAGLLSDEVAVQVVDTIKEKTAGTDTGSNTQGKVPDDHQGDRGSSEGLGGSGRATCQCWGPVGSRRSGKKDDHGERKHAEMEVTAGRKHNMCACKKACTRRATTGRRSNTHT